MHPKFLPTGKTRITETAPKIIPKPTHSLNPLPVPNQTFKNSKLSQPKKNLQPHTAPKLPQHYLSSAQRLHPPAKKWITEGSAQNDSTSGHLTRKQSKAPDSVT